MSEQLYCPACGRICDQPYSVACANGHTPSVWQPFAHLMESRRLLCLVWNHMHGQNMDGTRRPWPGEEGCAANWNKLSDAIGEYLEPLSQGLHPQEHGGSD